MWNCRNSRWKSFSLTLSVKLVWYQGVYKWCLEMFLYILLPKKKNSNVLLPSLSILYFSSPLQYYFPTEIFQHNAEKLFVSEVCEIEKFSNLQWDTSTCYYRNFAVSKERWNKDWNFPTIEKFFSLIEAKKVKLIAIICGK